MNIFIIIGEKSIYTHVIYILDIGYSRIKTPLFSQKLKVYADFESILVPQIKNQPDKLLEEWNNYHQNITLTIEVSPSKFSNTKIMIKNGIIETKNLQCLKKMIQILRTLLNVGFVIMFIISDAHMYLLFEKGMRM